MTLRKDLPSPVFDPSALRRRSAGLLLISAATILLQLSLTRVLAVMLWYHFGFVVISTSMLGIGGAALLLACSRRLREVVDLDRVLALLSLALAVAIAGGYVLLLWIPLAPFRLLIDPWQWLWGPLAVTLVGIPFALAGLIVSLLLARSGSAIHRLYAFDLVGAGVGAMAIIVAMPWLGGSGSVIACSVLAALSGVAFAGSGHRRLRLLNVVAALSLALQAAFAEWSMPIDTSVNKGPPPKGLRIATVWNAGSRVDVYQTRRHGGKRLFHIDGGVAATANLDLRPNVHAALAVRNEISTWAGTALTGREPGDVLVLGAGVGLDVLAALDAGARSITAVEVNPILTEAARGSMADYFGHLFDLPQIRLLTEDARAFLRRDRSRYDVILSVHTLSNAAIAAGALALAEDALFTREALDDWLDHLAEGGTIFITRPAAHLPRLCVTLREAWERRGWGDLRGRAIVFRSGYGGFSSGILVERVPLSSARRQAIEQDLSRSSAEIVYPVPAGDPVSIESQLLDEPDLGRILESSAEILDPSTDNRPFGGHRVRWLDLRSDHLRALFAADMNGRLAIEDQPIAEVTLLALLVGLTSTIAALLGLAYRRLRASRISARISSFYALLGLAFMLAEIALIHRAALLVGQPVIAYSIVLAVMFVCAGIGALLAGRLSQRVGVLRWILGVLPAVLLLAAWGQTAVARSILAWPFAARVIFVVTSVAPLAVLLGFPLALALRRLAEVAPERVPIAWAYNAFAAVLGSVLAVIIAISTGLASVFGVAGVLYLAAMVLAPRAERQC